jgi:acyl-CoA synthetase (AMP-forming)/AMP-acid ligase II
MAKIVTITPESTIPAVLRDVIQKYPERIAQVEGEARMTFRKFGQQVDRLATSLLDLGLRPGDKIAMVLPAGNTFPVCVYAIIQMGGVAVAMNPTLRPREFEHIFRDSEAAAVIVAEKIHGVNPIDILRKLRPELPHLRHILVSGTPADGELDLQALVNHTEPRHTYHQANPEDLAALVYTSGTTGLPKGSMHSHQTMLSPVVDLRLSSMGLDGYRNLVRRFGFKFLLKGILARFKQFIIYYSMPPYTGAGMIGVMGSFLSGWRMVHLDRFTPTGVLALIEKEHIGGLALPPALGIMLIRNPNLEKYDLSSLLYVMLGAAPVPPTLIDEFDQKLHVPVMNGFGATELFSTPTGTHPFLDSKHLVRETVGKAKPGYELAVVDENHVPLPPGAVGELAVRGKVRMLGYYKAPELTEKTFDNNGWYYTGDQATMDEQGYVRIVGRIKDLIIRGGQNIYPAEIEKVLVTHPKIRDAAVVGIPDPIAGEKVMAYLIPESNPYPSEVEVLNFCRENLAPYKVPSNAIFVNAFPLNASGKVLKRELREQMVVSA